MSLFAMRLAFILTALFAGLASPAEAAPVNDNFANATVIPNPGKVTGSNVDATTQPGEPDLPQPLYNHRTVWWRFTPTVTGRYVISTRQSVFDTELHVYTGSTLNALTRIASNNDIWANDRASWVAVNLTAGIAYRIRVNTYIYSSPDPYEGAITLWVLGPGPINDDFANRVAISGFRTVTGNNTGASFEPGEPDVNGPRNSVWWTFRSPTTGPLRINTFGSSFDTVLQVSEGNSVGTSTIIGTNDNAAGSSQSELVFNALAGGDYNISVSGYLMSRYGNIALTVAPGGTGTASIVSAVSPVARATTVNTRITAFATVINAGTSTATGCEPTLPAGFTATYVYRPRDYTTGALGTINGPMNIPAGGRQDFLLMVTPRTVATTNIAMVFDCTNTDPAPSYAGLNTLLLTATNPPAPADMIATTATAAGGGVMNIPLGGTGFAGVAAVNIGTAANLQLRLSASAIGAPAATLPVTMTVCRTNPTTGACLAPPAAPPVNFSAAANQTVTFSAFLKSNGTAIPFNPATKRLFLHFYQGTTAVGSTSVAVRTQ